MSSVIDTLLEMGFSKSKAERALIATDNQGVEAAMEWLLVHSEELEELGSQVEPMSVDRQPEHKDEVVGENSENVQASSEVLMIDPAAAKSLQCDECGKLFKTEIEVEYHAAKSGHQSYSESVVEVKPLTDEEKKDQLKRLEDRIKMRRQEKEEEQKRVQVEKEKMRRRTGQQIIESKKKMEEEEIKKMAELRRREKVEEKLARQRVLEQIERDKEARKKKFENISSAPAASAAPAVVVAVEPTATVNDAVKKEYAETKLQIRLTNGVALNQSFGSREELAAVRLYVEMNRTDGAVPFSLMTNFPRKIFTEEDMEKPLYELGLVPSAVLIVTKGK